MNQRFLDRIEIEDGKVKLIYAYYDTGACCIRSNWDWRVTEAIRSHPG